MFRKFQSNTYEHLAKFHNQLIICLILKSKISYNILSLKILFYMNNTLKLVSLGLMGTLAFGSVAAFAINTPAANQAMQNVQVALTNKDYTGWKTAEIALATERTNSITQDQFNTKAENYIKSQQVQTAIKNNDYNAFVASASDKMKSKITSQADFDILVTNQKVRADYQTKVGESVKNNDFASFKALEETKPESVSKPSFKNKGNKNQTLTDTQLQTKFDKMVENYKASGTLPGQNEGMKGIGHFGGMGFGEGKGKRGHKGFGEGMKSTNKNSQNSVSSTDQVL